MEKSKYAFPTINLSETGINLHRIMDKRGITPKDIKEFLNLGSIQTVYNWFAITFTKGGILCDMIRYDYYLRLGVK